MARARNIKPAIMDNEQLAGMKPLHRLLFIYLWMLADREGRLADIPSRIAKQALGYDRAANVDAMLDDLATADFITRYSAAGTKCIKINSFPKHQTPHGTEKDSDLPDENGLHTVHKRGKNGYSTGEVELVNRSLTVKTLSLNTLIPDSGLPDSGLPDCPDSGKPAAPATPKAKAGDRKTPIPADFEISERVRIWAAKGGFTRLDEHLEAFRRKCEANGYKKVNWDSAFMEAIREDWAKLRGRVANGSAPPADHASADELESRAAVEKQAFDKGLEAWNPITEQWPAYKTRVLRTPRLPSMGLDQLALLASKRQGAAA